MNAIRYEELAARVLAEIKRYPGCEGVADVILDRMIDERAENSRGISCVVWGNANPRTAEGAAIYAAAKLTRGFNLLSDF